MSSGTTCRSRVTHVGPISRSRVTHMDPRGAHVSPTWGLQVAHVGAHVSPTWGLQVAHVGAHVSPTWGLTCHPRGPTNKIIE